MVEMVNMTQSAKISEQAGKLMVTGDITFVTVMDFLAESLPLLKQCKELNFDFSNVKEVDSSALSLLIEWRKYAKRHNKPITFQELPQKLESIAAVSGVEKIIT